MSRVKAPFKSYLSAASITTGNPQRRAETLSIEEFARLADKLFEITRGM